MKRLLIVLSLLLSSLPSYAGELFYKVQTPQLWTILGDKGDETQNPACLVQKTWEDGSIIQYITDLKSGEFWIYLTNIKWDIDETIGKYDGMRINFYHGQDVKGVNVDFYLLNKNTVTIRGLSSSAIFSFVTSDKMIFVMPGNVPNAEIPLNGTDIAGKMTQHCMRTYISLPKGKVTVPSKKSDKDA